VRAVPFEITHIKVNKKAVNNTFCSPLKTSITKLLASEENPKKSIASEQKFSQRKDMYTPLGQRAEFLRQISEEYGDAD